MGMNIPAFSNVFFEKKYAIDQSKYLFHNRAEKYPS